MRQRKHILGLGFLLTAAITVPAFAQQPAPPPQQAYPMCTKTVTTAESSLAHEKYIAGKLDYDEANYDSALRRFRDS